MTKSELYDALFRLVHNNTDRAKLYNWLKDLLVISISWGEIGGTLSDQDDLNTRLTGLDTRINNISSLGRFLSIWNCQTGKPYTNPTTTPYSYKTGDYYIIGTLAKDEYPVRITIQLTDSSTIYVYYKDAISTMCVYENNNIEYFIQNVPVVGNNVYSNSSLSTVVGTITSISFGAYEFNALVPSGSSYSGNSSTTVYQGLTEPNINDVIRYDGTNWIVDNLETREIKWGDILGNITNQTDLNAALNAKELLTNKITTITAQSTDTQYPSAKAVYDFFYQNVGDYIVIDNTLNNLDPSTKITGYLGKDYNNAIRWIRNNSHCYVMQSFANDSAVMKQLSDSDRTLYADGTSAATDITEKDVFMKLPEFWYKCEEISSGVNKWKIEFSSSVKTGWNHWEGNTFIGVYEAALMNGGSVINPTAERVYTAGDTVHSISGVTPCVYYSQSSFKQAARAKGTGFSIVTYEAHQILALLFYAYYGNLNSQAVCGSGTSSYPKTTGNRNSLAMVDTTTSNGNSNSINFWGIENWWGDICEWIDNIVTAGSGIVNLLNLDGTTNRQIQGSAGGDKEIAQMVFGSYGDVIPNGYYTDSAYATYYSDYGFVNGGSGYVARRSNPGAGARGGVGCFDAHYGSSYVYSDIGSRLQYKGDYSIQ